MFLARLSNFLIIPVVREKIRVKLAPAITMGPPTTLTEEITQTPPLKTIKILSIYSKAATYLLHFLLHNFLKLTSWLK